MHFHTSFLRFLCLSSSLLLLRLLIFLGRFIWSSEDVIVGLIWVALNIGRFRFFFISTKDITGLLWMLRTLLVLRLFNNVSIKDVALSLLMNLHGCVSFSLILVVFITSTDLECRIATWSLSNLKIDIDTM